MQLQKNTMKAASSEEHISMSKAFCSVLDCVFPEWFRDGGQCTLLNSVLQNVALTVSCLLCNLLNYVRVVQLVASFSPSCPRSCRADVKDNTFSRSRSSSVASIDRESREAVSSLYFCESFPRKSDSLVSPCLLVGTTQGSVMVLAVCLPPGGDQRLQQPVSFSSCGKTLMMNFMDVLF